MSVEKYIVLEVLDKKFQETEYPERESLRKVNPFELDAKQHYVQLLVGNCALRALQTVIAVFLFQTVLFRWLRP